MRPILVIEQDSRLEGLGLLGKRLAALGLPVHRLRVWEHDIEDVRIESYSALVPLGGSAHAWADDEHPHLRVERDLLGQAIDREVPVLGICLGAQVLALTLGAEVRSSGRHEYGWIDIAPTPEAAGDPLLAHVSGPVGTYQWHLDEFSLPHGSVRLATGEMCVNQAFRYGSAWGVQFHPEVDYETFRLWLGNHPEVCEELGIDEPALHREVEAGDRRDWAWRAELFDAFGRLVEARERER